MRITVLGATGKTGREVVDQALAAGHTVTALVRRPEALDLRHPELSVVGGDAREAADLSKAVAGSAAVISTLGSMKAGDQLIRRSTHALVTAAAEVGVDRVVVLSSFLAAPNYRPNLAGRLMAPMMKGMVADKTAGETELSGSQLNWTVVHATGLDRAAPGTPVRIVGPAQTVSMSNGIARKDVASFLLDEVAGTGHPRSAVVITAT